MKKNIKYINQKNDNNDEIQYCCSQENYLFHDYTELRGFRNENDFFSVDEVV
jgi:hypothetical protein